MVLRILKKKLADAFVLKDIENMNFCDQVKEAQFEITNRCNLSCSICWRSLGPDNVQANDMSIFQFEEAIEKLLKIFPIENINTQGLGEPLMCPDFLKILKTAKSRKLGVWFVTNGTLIDEPIAEQLINLGVDKIRISVDSADPSIYSGIKIGSSLDILKRNILLLSSMKKGRSVRPLIAFNTVVLNKNISGLNSLVFLAKECGVEEITLIPMVVFSKGQSVVSQRVDFESAEFKKVFDELRHIAESELVELNLGVSMETKNRKFCHSGLYIDVLGNVRPCCNISRISFGNVYSDKADSIKKKYTGFRKQYQDINLDCIECNKALDG